MPGQVEIDLAVMTDTNSDIRVGGIAMPDGVSLLTDAEEIVARVEVPRGAIGEESDESEAEAQEEESD